MKLFSCLCALALLVASLALLPSTLALCASSIFLCCNRLITGKDNLLHTLVAKLPFRKLVHHGLIFCIKSLFFLGTNFHD